MATTEVQDRHLLVVDDDDRIRDLLKQYLTRNGFRVATAAGALATTRAGAGPSMPTIGELERLLGA